MDRRAGEQPEAHRPERGPQALQEMGVAIELIRRTEHLEVADEVARDEGQEDRPGDGHEKLLADRGAEEVADEIHR